MVSQLLSQITWDGGAGTNAWHDAANWSTNSVPNESDDVLLDQTTLITLNKRALISSIEVSKNASLIIYDTLEIKQNSAISGAICHIKEGYIENNGFLKIQSGINGIQVGKSNLHNFGSISILAETGILNMGTFNNYNELYFEEINHCGIVNEGTFINSGSICMDGSNADDGISNTGSFNSSGYLLIRDVGTGIMNRGSFTLESDSYTGVAQFAQDGVDTKDQEFIVEIDGYLFIEQKPNCPLDAFSQFSIDGELAMAQEEVIPINELYGGSDFEGGPINGIHFPDGHIVIASSSSSLSGDVQGPSNGSRDWWIVKTDLCGKIIWENLFGGSETDITASGILMPDESIVIAGEIRNGHTDGWVIKLNASGHIIWDTFIDEDGGVSPKSIVELNDGYMVGSRAVFSGINFMLNRLDNNGMILWDSLYGGSGQENMSSMIKTSDDGIVMTGNSSSSQSGDVTHMNNGGSDMWILKTDLDGTVLWDQLLGTPVSENGNCILELSNGDLLIAGFQDDNSDPSYEQSIMLVKLTGSGQMIWTKFYSNPGMDLASGDLISTPDNGILVVGNKHVSDQGSITKAYILKLSANGDVEWEKEFGGIDGRESFSDIHATQNGFYLYAFSTSSNVPEIRDSKPGSGDIWVTFMDYEGNIVY